MSSSKGIGSSAREIADFLPPEMLRFLMVKTPPKRTVNFSTSQEYLVKLFNEYDKLLDKSRSGAASPEEKMILKLSAPDHLDPSLNTVNFQVLCAALQIPHLDIEAEIRRRLVLPSNAAIPSHVRRRMLAAQYWINNLASPGERIVLQESLPKSAWDLSHWQRYFLHLLARDIEQIAKDEEALQGYIFHVARLTPIAQSAAFEAIYRVLFDADHGPKAGALLSFLDVKLLVHRFTSLEYSTMQAWLESSINFAEFENQLAGLRGKVTSAHCRTRLVVMRAHGDSNLDGRDILRGNGFIEFLWQDSENRTRLMRVAFSQFEGFGTTPHREWEYLVSQANEQFGQFAKSQGISLTWDTTDGIVFEDEFVTVH